MFESASGIQRTRILLTFTVSLLFSEGPYDFATLVLKPAVLSRWYKYFCESRMFRNHFMSSVI